MSTYSLYNGPVSFTLNSAASVVKVTTTAHQGYANLNGSKPWGLTIYLDGGVIGSVGGAGAYTETPICVGVAKNVAAGQHTVEVTWYGESAMQLSSDTTTVEFNYK